EIETRIWRTVVSSVFSQNGEMLPRCSGIAPASFRPRKYRFRFGHGPRVSNALKDRDRFASALRGRLRLIGDHLQPRQSVEIVADRERHSRAPRSVERGGITLAREIEIAARLLEVSAPAIDRRIRHLTSEPSRQSFRLDQIRLGIVEIERFDGED